MTLKDKLWIILTIILVIIIFTKPYKKVIIPEDFKKEIQASKDSISKKDTLIIVQKQNVASIESSIKTIQKDLKILNEKLKKDTILVNNFPDSTVLQFFRSRYNY